MPNKLLFVVTGRKGAGMGHAYRVADLHRSITGFEKTIVCTRGSHRAYSFLRQSIDNVLLVRAHDTLYGLIDRLRPDVIVNDILNTKTEYVTTLKERGATVINFEDLGPGGLVADLTINAVYAGESTDKTLYGSRYFDLRDEFVGAGKKRLRPNVQKILVTFGGEDPANLTERVLRVVAGSESLRTKEYTVLVGPAYRRRRTLRRLIERSGLTSEVITTATPARLMLDADMAISSNGRTPFELAALGIPAIVISANDRERLHTFHEEAAFLHCGQSDQIEDTSIAEKIRFLAESFETRVRIRRRLDVLDVRQSRQRLLERIHETISA
jgi:spore coat polysaccharide biosynthesis predicted glycosyltransferase SpsG